MRVKTDLHIHTVLSACADPDNTPENIVNLCQMLDVNIMAVADHNAVLNFPAIDNAAKANNILAVPAMEVTTQEDIHVLCLFADYQSAIKAQNAVWQGLPSIPLDGRIYMPQQVIDKDGEVTSIIPNLLSVACAMDVYQLKQLVEDLGGMCIPAHVDKSGAMLDVLGEIPPDLGYSAVEISSNCPPEIENQLSKDYFLLHTSDAHDLERLCYSGSTLEVENVSIASLFAALKKH